MNYGVDNIIAKVMADKNTSGEIAVAVLDILRTAAQIEEMYKNHAPVIDQKNIEPEAKPIVRRRKHKVYTIDGKTKTIDEWCEEYGVKRNTLEKKIYGGKMNIEDALKDCSLRTGRTNKITVIQCDRFGKQIRQFDSVSKMARELQIPIGRAHRALRMTPSEQVNDYGFYFMTA